MFFLIYNPILDQAQFDAINHSSFVLKDLYLGEKILDQLIVPHTESFFSVYLLEWQPKRGHFHLFFKIASGTVITVVLCNKHEFYRMLGMSKTKLIKSVVQMRCC